MSPLTSLRLRPAPVSSLWAAVTILAAGSICSTPSQAGVVVLANRTREKIDFALVPAERNTTRHCILKAREVIPIPVTDQVGIMYAVGGTTQRKQLQAGSIYYFVIREKGLELGKVRLPPPTAEAELPASATPSQPIESVYTVPVMLLADEDERAVRRIWEKRFRDRLARASEIVEQHCRVRFEVVAVGTWNSDNHTLDFAKSLREFELEVHPAPARLAIGFTSQYNRPPKRRIHLGGTRGTLHSHILIREWAQHVTEIERLEILLHELGHYLGATHSPEADSVMRSVLGDHRAHARDFRIGFDPVNTFIMYLLGEELRAGRGRNVSRLDPHAKAQLRSAYLAMAQMLPQDESTKNYLKLLDQSAPARAKPTRHAQSLVEAVRVVVQAITKAARRNNAMPTGPGDAADGPSRLSGDRLTERYVRRAAAAAAEFPSEMAAKAFLLGLGIALDDSLTLRYAPIVSDLCRRVESSRQRYERLTVLGSPTMRGRRDLTKHFAVSSVLTVLIGPQAAEAAGIAKELVDCRRRSGFSFVDLSADLAGVAFAGEVRDGKIPLERLAQSFAVDDFVPEGSGLAEGISWEDFQHEYGSAQDDRFQLRRRAIRRRILALPGYRSRQGSHRSQ